MKKILVVDDDIAVTNYLMVLLMQSGEFDPTVLNDSRKVPALLERETFTAILLDMDMPGLSGMDICVTAKERGLTTPIIILTGVNDVDMAVKALKLGAFDYLTKPVDDNFLLDVIHRAIEHGNIPKTPSLTDAHKMQEDLDRMEGYEVIPPVNPAMVRLFAHIGELGATDEPILIIGERGSGKKAAARGLHHASRRREGPFVVMDLSTQNHESFMVDFFGQAPDWRGERASRPGLLESADNGTLCISNFERLPMPVQVRLDSVIADGVFYRQGSTRSEKVDMRLVAVSCYDLSSPEFASRFSSSLLRRMLGNILRIPALRERPEDIAHIARKYAQAESRRTGHPAVDLDPALLDLLKVYPFPGNLQELRDIVATSVMRTNAGVVKIDALSPYVRDKMIDHAHSGGFEPGPLAEVEFAYVRRTLDHFSGNRARACETLGIDQGRLDSILARGRKS